MSDLESLLSDPDVEVVDSTDEFGPGEAERVAEGYNRAAAAVVRDDEGRVLLMRRGGWRLPGTDVELGWFAECPRDVVNDGVMDRVFGDEQ